MIPFMNIREMSTSLPIALVTGASWSIDAASTILLVQQGYLVFINYGLNNSAALKVCQSVTEQAGSAQICGADVSTKDNPVIHENNLGYTFDEILEEIANDVGRNMDESLETIPTTYAADDWELDLTEEGSVEVDYIRTNVVEVDEEQTTDRNLWDGVNFPF